MVRKSVRATDTADEAAIDITNVETTTLSDGRGRVIVTIRVFNVGFDAVDYDGQVSLTSGSTTYETVNIRGSAGAGPDADEQTIRLETNSPPPGEAVLTASLSNGDQEQQTVQFVQDDPGFGDPEPLEIVDCSTSRAFNDGLSVEFSVDGTAGESFTATIRVDGQQVDQQSWTLGSRTPTSYEQIVDPDDLPVGQDMPVEIGVDGDFRDCGTVSVESDDPADQPGDTPASVALSCGSLPDTAPPGDFVQIRYDVENTGDTRADVTVQLLRNGSEITTEDVSVFPRTTRTANFYAQVGTEPGEYTFEIQTV